MSIAIAWAFVKAAWNFLTSPLGIALVIVVTLLCTHWYAFSSGEASKQVEWDAANAKAAIERAQTDTAITKRAETRSAEDAAAEADAERLNNEARNAYIVELEKRSNRNVCVLDDTDIQRTRRLHNAR